MKEQTNGERFEEFMNSLDKYPELEGTNALCDDIIKKKTGKMTEEEWQAAENNLKPKYTPGKGISFYIENEISDEEIEKASAKLYTTPHGSWGFVQGAKWYREQLKNTK